MIVMPRTFDTARLHMRAPVESDASAIFAYASDVAVTYYMEWPAAQDLDDTHEFLEDVAWGWEGGDDYCYALIERESQRLIGAASCQFGDHGAELGYILARQSWGQGLATEAASALFDAARKIDDVHRFWAACDIDNTASMRVLEKLGMRREGILRRWSERPNMQTHGVPRDVIIYAWVR